MSDVRLLPGLENDRPPDRRRAPFPPSTPSSEYRDATIIASLDSRTPYRNTLSIVRPLVDRFCRSDGLGDYPWIREQTDLEWIFDACYNALGRDEAAAALSFQNDLGGGSPPHRRTGRPAPARRVPRPVRKKLPNPAGRARRRPGLFKNGRRPIRRPTPGTGNERSSIFTGNTTWAASRRSSASSPLPPHLFRRAELERRSCSTGSSLDVGESQGPGRPARRAVRSPSRLERRRDRAVFQPDDFSPSRAGPPSRRRRRGRRGRSGSSSGAFLSTAGAKRTPSAKQPTGRHRPPLMALLQGEFPQGHFQQDRHFILQDRQNRIVGRVVLPGHVPVRRFHRCGRHHVPAEVQRLGRSRGGRFLRADGRPGIRRF